MSWRLHIEKCRIPLQLNETDFFCFVAMATCLACAGWQSRTMHYVACSSRPKKASCCRKWHRALPSIITCSFFKKWETIGCSAEVMTEKSKCLGVSFSFNRTWNSHVNYITVNAIRVLSFFGKKLQESTAWAKRAVVHFWCSPCLGIGWCVGAPIWLTS